MWLPEGLGLEGRADPGRSLPRPGSALVARLVGRHARRLAWRCRGRSASFHRGGDGTTDHRGPNFHRRGRSLQRAERLEAASGFEPESRGFEDLRLNHLATPPEPFDYKGVRKSESTGANRGVLTRDGRPSYIEFSRQGGNSSVVECDLAKVEVAGSNPVSRSIPSPTPHEPSASKAPGSWRISRPSTDTTSKRRSVSERPRAAA